jgi:FtsP/CotA-like multicopper oxidase with cupredoxin domain
LDQYNRADRSFHVTDGSHATALQLDLFARHCANRDEIVAKTDADNPGRWAFHCHNLYHMMTGMLTEVRYSGII